MFVVSKNILLLFIHILDPPPFFFNYTKQGLGLGQYVRVGRPWAHLLSWAHQNYNYLRRNYWWERAKSSRKDLLQLKIRKRIDEMGKRGRVVVLSRSIPPGRWPTNRRLITTTEVLPTEQRVWAPRQLPSLGVFHWEDNPQEYLA